VYSRDPKHLQVMVRGDALNVDYEQQDERRDGDTC
jgi:hypothetical protein